MQNFCSVLDRKVEFVNIAVAEMGWIEGIAGFFGA